MFQQLTRPFAFLGIQHPDVLLRWVRWWLPLILASLLTGAVLAVKGLDVYGNEGLFAKLLNFLQSLPGFYLAALAAVSTFPSKAMDEFMPGIPPTARIVYNGALTEVKLSRRRMLCMLFAYLTALSFIITLALIFATSFASPLSAVLDGAARSGVRAVGVFIVFALTAQLLIITLWGLFYLGERVHTPDSSANGKNEPSSD